MLDGVCDRFADGQHDVGRTVRFKSAVCGKLRDIVSGGAQPLSAWLVVSAKRCDHLREFPNFCLHQPAEAKDLALANKSAMRPTRIAALLLVVAILSALNYWWYYERTQAAIARARSAVYTNNVEYAIGQPLTVGSESRHELNNMVGRELMLVVAVGIGAAVLVRRKIGVV